MLNEVVIRPMTEDVILWRCLHGGALSKKGLGEPAADAGWEERRVLNTPVLRQITQAYGSCAIVAMAGECVVGSVRFYPKSLCSTGGGMCLQGSLTGPTEVLAAKGLPALEQMADKTLRVHCMATGSPFQKENPYQRKGLASAMIRALIRWAKVKGWRAIEAGAFEDLGILYEHSGGAGRRFWEKLGFRGVETRRAKREFGDAAREQAVALGLGPESGETYTVRLEAGDPSWEAA